MNFCGVFAPIPTPFVDDELDLGALRDNLARWMETDLAGIVVLGTNGESAQVNDDEADHLIVTTRTVMPADRLVIAGTGRESTRATVTATHRAADAGADAVLVRTPSFFKALMTEEALSLEMERLPWWGCLDGDRQKWSLQLVLHGDEGHMRGAEAYWPIPAAQAVASAMRTMWDSCND